MFFTKIALRTGAYSRTISDESFKSLCHDLALHKNLVSFSFRKYLCAALVDEAEKDAAAKGMTRNKTSSACAADAYHGGHAAFDVGGKVGRKEVTRVDTMSPALLRAPASRTKSASIVSAEPTWKNIVEASDEKATSAPR